MLRRYVFVILFFVVLVAPFILKAIYGSSGNLNRPGALQLVIVTPHVESIRTEFALAFSDWHQRKFGQPVDIDYRLLGGASDIVRYFEAGKQALFVKQGTYRIDIAWGGGDVLFNRLKSIGVLEPIRLPESVMRYAFPRPTLEGVPLYDIKGGEWYGTCLSSFGICYNRDICKYLGTGDPLTWNALADPRFDGWLILADPTRSGAANAAFMTIVEKAMLDAGKGEAWEGEAPAEPGVSRDKRLGRSLALPDGASREDVGWARGVGLIRLISSNARQFTDSGTAVPGIVAAGDAAAGMAIDFQGRAEVDAVGEDRLGYVEPVGATTLSPDPIAVIRGAEHMGLAIRFVEFVLSEQGQRLWITKAGAPGGPKYQSLRRLPIAPLAYSDQRNFTDHVDPFGQQLGFPTSSARKNTFRILAKLIELSCIDLLDELRETRRAIERAKRPDLLEKLGTFPFDQQEAIRRGAEWDRGDPLKKLELERKWKDEFREEYRRLRETARTGEERAPGGGA